MKTNRVIVWLSVLLLMIRTVMGVEKRQTEHVILISVDGLSASYLNDPRAEIPNIRAIAASGVEARGMQVSFPSVTWPSHVSLITGTWPARHGVIGNSVWNRKSKREIKYIGDPVLTKAQAIRVPTLYDLAHEAGLSTASVIWPCSNGATTLDWIIPDSNKPELHSKYTTPGFADELASVGIDISKLGEWGWGKRFSTQRDLVYSQTAIHLLTRHKVNLLLLHLITPDGVQHVYGSNTPQAYHAVAESDMRIGEIWHMLNQSEFADNSTLFIVSDHGFANYNKVIQPNAVLKELGLIKTSLAGVPTGRKAWCVAQGGSAFIYVLEDQGREEMLDLLARKFAALEGVLDVMHPGQFSAFGFPSPEDNPEAPDLVLSTGPGYSFVGTVNGGAVVDAGGIKGNHGHDPRPDFMHAMFVATGEGIKSGGQLGIVESVDVAPTIAYLLGIDFECDGRVLVEALAEHE